MSDMAPEMVLRPALQVMHFAAFTTRNWTLDDQVSRRQIYDLWEAIHEIPDLLCRWREHSEAELLSYFDEYDQAWPSPRLREMYAQAVASMGGQDGSDVLRQWRLNDFQRRARFNPSDVYRHRAHGWEYIPIHPFGDEADILSRLGLKPEDCRSVDAWCAIGGDATLFESIARPSKDGDPQLFAKATDRPEGYVYLAAILNQPFITRSSFEEAMTRFAEAGFPRDPRFRLTAGDPSIPI